MTQRRIPVLILEDKKGVAKSIEIFLRKTCDVTLVHNEAAAISKISSFYDCFVFDVTLPDSEHYGHEILLMAMAEGKIKAPCIVMTAVLDIESLIRDTKGKFADFVDKRLPGWHEDLREKIVKHSGKDYRESYLRDQFARINALEKKFDVSISNGEQLGMLTSSNMTYGQIIDKFRDSSINEEGRKNIFEVLLKVYHLARRS